MPAVPKAWQARKLQAYHLHKGQDAVDAIEDLGGLRLLWNQLGKYGPRRFRPGEVRGADAQGGEHGGGQHQHAHAAQPVGEGAPEQDPLGQGFNIGQNGGAGGGKAGAGLKHTVHKGVEISRKIKGQSAEYAGENPDQTHCHKALTGKEVAAGRKMGQQGSADQDNQDAV